MEDPRRQRHTVKRTNLTDRDIDEKDASTPAGAILNPVNKEFTSDEEKSSAGRILGGKGKGSKKDKQITRDAAKKIEKNPPAKGRDRREKEDS